MIETLIQDIYELLQRKDGWLNHEMAAELGAQVALRMQEQFKPRTQAPQLRLSSLGPRCPCALWHSIHTPGEAEALPAYAINKFSYGHLVEAWAICLAKAAGHSVLGEQDAVVVDEVVGHRDCILDGYIADVKSCSSQGFEKFKNKTLAKDDPFGYLYQLDSYVLGSSGDPLLKGGDRAFILAVDKVLGRMVLYEHRPRVELVRARIEELKKIINLPSPPPCTCRSVRDETGSTLNMKLDMRASYEPMKFCCNPNLRLFRYSDGPHYLTKVVRKPNVTELDRQGNPVYH